jgi:two-component system chemotaxis sensor kinase CheA
VFEIAGQSGRRQSVVVVKSAGKRVGIVVDELLGELQAVIKPLSKLFEQLQGVAGSTILGNGNVALILDLPGLTARGQDHSTRLYGTPPVGRAVLESTAG